MKTVAVIGASGFVGSAFVRQALGRFQVTEVTRDSYEEHQGKTFDVVVDASGNSRKYLADESPLLDFDASVRQRLRTIIDFPAATHVHVSSVDVYSDLSSEDLTREETLIDRSRQSPYGFHKLLAEDVVRRYAKDWLIVRLAGMVGPSLRKNPVFDILNGHELRIHAESRYQYMRTDVAAEISLWLLEQGERQVAMNICGSGLITLQEIANLAQKELRVASGAQIRVVHASTARIRALRPVETTREAIQSFLKRT